MGEAGVSPLLRETQVLGLCPNHADEAEVPSVLRGLPVLACVGDVRLMTSPGVPVARIELKSRAAGDSNHIPSGDCRTFRCSIHAMIGGFVIWLPAMLGRILHLFRLLIRARSPTATLYLRACVFMIDHMCGIIIRQAACHSLTLASAPAGLLCAP